MVARLAHAQKAAGSNPAPATKKNKLTLARQAGFYYTKNYKIIEGV